MIGYIKDEPKIKKVFIGVIVSIILVYGLFIIFQYSQLNQIHKKQIITFQRAVGTIVEDYPEKESEVVKAVFQSENTAAEKLGAEILKKYGYDLEMEMLNDKNFIEYRIGLVAVNSITMIILLIFNIILLMLIFKRAFIYLDRVSEALNNFIKGNYSYDEYDLDEGIVAKVSNQLSHLGNRIELEYNKLIDEKESSKALVTDISHQLKTPLASLKMCNDILLDEELKVEERKEFLDSSQKGVTKLEYLVDALVNISRLEADMIKIKPVENSIKETLTKAIKSVYIKALDKNIDIELKEFNDYIIPHDDKWTEEAIFNVLENSVKYTKTGGKVEVSVSENVNYVTINIKDNGIGIKKEEFNNIFKRFYRGKSQEVKNIEGSGVGLYLTRKILEEQGGNIMVKERINVGSKFIILLRKN